MKELIVATLMAHAPVQRYNYVVRHATWRCVNYNCHVENDDFQACVDHQAEQVLALFPPHPVFQAPTHYFNPMDPVAPIMVEPHRSDTNI